MKVLELLFLDRKFYMLFLDPGEEGYAEIVEVSEIDIH
jgi:hypothetical protein